MSTFYRLVADVPISDFASPIKSSLPAAMLWGHLLSRLFSQLSKNRANYRCIRTCEAACDCGSIRCGAAIGQHINTHPYMPPSQPRRVLALEALGRFGPIMMPFRWMVIPASPFENLAYAGFWARAAPSSKAFWQSFGKTSRRRFSFLSTSNLSATTFE